MCRDGEDVNRIGRAALAAYIDEQWSEVIEVLGYECREIHYPSDPSCLGRSEPEHSTCWSTHAAGRAIDVVVGGEPDEPIPHGLLLGNEIVSAFLASEGGVEHHLARIAWEQEILWNGRCWHPEDRAVMSAADMEACGVSGHSDHIHLTLLRCRSGRTHELAW